MNEREIAAGLAATPGYRYAEAVGDRLYLAGQVPLDQDGRLVGPDDVAAQASQCLANLWAVLAANGFAVADVRRITVHVVGDRPALSEAWRAVVDGFAGTAPPATLLGAARLGYDGQLVEIDADVERPPGRSAEG